MALFGMTAKQWRDNNPDKEGNIRDYANVNELVCLIIFFYQYLCIYLEILVAVFVLLI